MTKMNRLNRFLLMIALYCAMAVFPHGVLSQENVKIMTYNLLNYPDVDSAIRNPNFRTVIRASGPDILVVQEMTSQAGMNGFLSNVMNAYGNVYSAGTFIDGTDTDNGIFFKTAKFSFISNTRIRTALRDINLFKIIHVNYPADTLQIFSVHLKSSGGAVNEQLRASEVDSLRKFTSSLAPGQSYMVVGDFNIYGDYEQAYIKLKQVTNGSGHFVDPITGMTGSWNQFAYRQYHTQSPRVRGFGGGSTGGMDDRFDMMLFSPGIMNSGRIAYVAGSMTAFGNDGNHYNDSINRRPNTAVPDSVADAIHYAADHIPVYAVFTFGNSIGISANGSEIPSEYSLSQNYPNPFNPATKINFDIPMGEVTGGVVTRMVIFNMLGSRVDVLVNQSLKPGSYSVEWNASNFPSGVYIYSISSGNYRASRKMIFIK